jgi:hypothetical protein
MKAPTVIRKLLVASLLAMAASSGATLITAGTASAFTGNGQVTTCGSHGDGWLCFYSSMNFYGTMWLYTGPVNTWEPTPTESIGSIINYRNQITWFEARDGEACMPPNTPQTLSNGIGWWDYATYPYFTAYHDVDYWYMATGGICSGADQFQGPNLIL